MSETYGTIQYEATVQSGGTTAVSAAFERTGAIVGGMNTAEGSATEGEVQTLTNSNNADTLFGENSDLTRQVRGAFANGVGTLYAIPVTETGTTDTVTATASGVLQNAPVFDPNVHEEHEVTATDTTAATTVDVNIVYDEGADIATPSEADTINLNPVTGEFEADESSDYELSYTYGDYTSAIKKAAELLPRIVGVATAATDLGNDWLTEANTYDTDFGFMHGIIGAMPNADAETYDDSFDDRRLSVAAASRGYLDDAETEEAWTIGALVGKQAGKALGDSSTYEPLNGFASLRTSYLNTEIQSLIDKQVMPLKNSGGIKVVKDMTTSTDPQFERLYASEIADEATEISRQISENFTGEKNTEDNRLLLRESHTTSYEEMSDDDLLEDYFVSVEKGATDFEVDMTIGLDIIGLMDFIDVEIVIGDVVRNGGVN